MRQRTSLQHRDRKSAEIIGNPRIFRRQRVDIANLDISGLHAWPFGTRTEKPTAAPNHACCVESVAGD